jgi:FMN phosphatase YigB (HAD superfamily)
VIGQAEAVTIAVVLWDFGDTLVDERWMLQAPPDFAEWPTAWTDVVTERAHDWNIGRLTEADIFRELADRTRMTLPEIESHAAACCRSIRFHPAAWRAATERRRPQALVTVNPDLFVERVSTPYRLHEHFDAVVVSCIERTDDKNELCRIALDRLGFTGPRSEALLIDNRHDLTDAWTCQGGTVYDFRSDDQFEIDWPGVLG